MEAKKNFWCKKIFKKLLCLAVAISAIKIFSYGKNKVAEERKMREKLSERQIDKMVESSFPASDPPSTY